MVEEN